MSKKSTSLSRKDALKRMGGFALGVPFGLPFVSSAFSAESLTSESTRLFRKKKPDNPNVLFLTLEGVPLRVLSCYGSQVMETPNIDRIAKNGMQFNNSFCNNALCAPSRATLLTGKYNHEAGQEVNGYVADPDKPKDYFDPTQETFPKLLKRKGYKTGMVGKWHLREQNGDPVNPADVGFDYFSFKRGAGGPYYDESGFIENPSVGSKKMEHHSHSGYITDTFTDIAIDGMKKFKKSGHPFFMAMQFFSVHRPFDPPHKYEHIYDEVRFPEPGTFWDDYKDRSSAARTAHMRLSDMKDFNPPKDYTKRQLRQWNYQQLMRHFLGTLKALDDNVGRLLDYLDNAGLADDTIVVLTGDHGFFLGEHGWFDKRFMYEEALRIPWLIRYPGVVKPGSRTEAWVQSIDNAPTIMDMLGLDIPDDMQGRSLVPVFENDGKLPKDWPKSMYYHYYEFGYPHFVYPNYGIRTERYKLIYYYTINEWELFDLKRDPDEMESLFFRRGMRVKSGYEDVFNDLVKQLKELRKKYNDTTGGPVKVYPREDYN